MSTFVSNSAYPRQALSATASDPFIFYFSNDFKVEDWTYVNLVFVERAWIVIWNEASADVRT